MRKGQSSIEYLTTYGWVFFVVLLGTGTLYYFGLLDFGKYFPDKCYFGSQFVCEDFRILDGSPDKLTLTLRNNYHRDIEVINVVSIDHVHEFSVCFTPVDIGIGLASNVECEFSNDLRKGEKYLIPVRITFERNATGDDPDHSIEGEVYTTAI